MTNREQGEPAMNMHRRDPVSFIAEGVRRLNPAQANAVLSHCHYEHQRPISKLHVSALREMMQRGQWSPKDKLDFARLNGRLILVNGHHRMAAQSESGRDIEWIIAVHDCDSEAEVRSLYYKFDTNVRTRSENNILAGIGFAEECGLTQNYAIGLYRATGIIMQGLRAGNVSDQKVMAEKRIVDERLDVARRFQSEARDLQDVFESCDYRIRRRLLSGGFFSVALVTMKHQHFRAMEFWRGLAENDGLRKGDPRQLLREHMLAGIGRDGSMQRNIIAPVKAWNAFYEERPLKMLKLTNSVDMPVLGTPYRVGL